MKVINPEQSYTFSKIFELKIEPKDLAKYFGYLIALEQWQENKGQTHLVGAVTTGKIWEFARLNRDEKQIEQGLESYRVPEDLDFLMRILVRSLSKS